MAKCDLLLVKVWNTACGSAIQMCNNAGCNSDSPIAEIELLVGRDLEAFGDSLQWPSLASMPHLKQIEDRRDMLMDRRALDRLAVARGGAVQRAGGDGGDAAGAGNFQTLPAAPAGEASSASSGLAFRAGKHGTTVSTSDSHMELVFRLSETTRVALVGKNPVGAGRAQYCRICQTHGSVHGKTGSHECNKANSQLQDGTVRSNLHEPIPVGTVVSREFLAMMACQYGGIHSGPYYPTAEDRHAAHNSFIRGPATVKCGGGTVGSPSMRDEHPILPLERTADGGLGRMMSANGMKPGDVYRSDERGLEEVVSDEVDASWVFSDHSLAVPNGPGVARALSTRDAGALVVRHEVLRRIVESSVAFDEQKNVRLVVQNPMAHVLEAVLKERGALCPYPVSRLTAGDLEEAHRVTLQALAADGETRRVRSASGQAASGMAHGAHQGDEAAGVAGEWRSGGIGHAELAGAFTRTYLTAIRSSFTYSLETGSSIVWSGTGADLGDAAHWAAPAQSAGAPVVGSRAVSNACVYNVLAKIMRTHGEQAVAATAAGAQPPPWAVQAAPRAISSPSSTQAPRLCSPPPVPLRRR